LNGDIAYNPTSVGAVRQVLNFAMVRAFSSFLAQLQKSSFPPAENSLLGAWSLSHYSRRHDCKGLAPQRTPTHAVWHSRGAQVALLRWLIPRESDGIISHYAGGLKR